MARFDVYPNPGPRSATTPYVLDVQSDLFDALGSRVVIPLRDLQHFSAIKLPTRLTPVVQIEGKRYLLETPKLAAVPLTALKTPVASLAAEQDAITGALDFLFQGY